MATHCAEVEHIYPVILDSIVAPGSAAATLSISPALRCFDGHFSANPIAPGVAQISWAVHFARELLAMGGPIKSVERLKFTHVIQPNQVIRLSLNYKPEKNAVQFCFDRPTPDAPIVFSQGWLIYEL